MRSEKNMNNIDFMMKNKKVAVVHDGTIHPGGAVRVVLEATKALDADLYVGFSGKSQSWWQEKVPNRVKILRETSRDKLFNTIVTTQRILKLDLNSYDVVLTSGPSAKFVQPYDDQMHIHYLHHPPVGKLWYSGGLFQYFTSIIDRIETLTIPKLIANSELTADRTISHYNRKVERVIFPPVEVKKFRHDRERVKKQIVMVGRLEERKRTEIAIEAMKLLSRYTLKLIGEGPRRKFLERSSPDNVDFLGYVDDETLRETVETSQAALFLARREDFGITPIEYMAAGTPIVGVDEPNTNNQIDQSTGTLVMPEPDAVAEGIRNVAGREWNHKAIQNQSQEYSVDRFREEIQNFVKQT